MNNKTLKIIHITSWLFLLAQMALEATFSLVIRIPELNIMPGVAVFYTGFILFARRKQAGRFGKIYYWFYPLYPLVLVITFCIHTLLATILLAPVYALFPQGSTYLSNSNYTIKSRGGFMATPQHILYRHHLIFNKEIGTLPDFGYYESLDTFRQFRVQDSAGVETTVTLSTSTFDTTLPIYPPQTKFDLYNKK